MNDRDLKDAYQRVLERRGHRREDCVTPEALFAVAQRTAPEQDRLRTLRHVGSCPRCRTELDLLITAADAAEQVARPAWRRPAVLAMAASVALVLTAVLWQRGRYTVPDVMRQGSSSAVQLLAPRADQPVSRPVTLVWAAVPAARNYEVEILDPNGTAVYAASTSDTTLAIPDTAVAAGIDYQWWVRAVTADGTRASLTRRLRIAAP